MTAPASASRKYFFAYAREDGDFVLQLATDLRANGVNIWLDQLDVIGGQRWDHAVEAALQRCEGLFVVLSPDSVASQNVMDEVSYALDEGKLVIPIMWRLTSMPFRLRRVQYVDFTTQREAGFAQLLRAVENAARGRPITDERPTLQADVAATATAPPSARKDVAPPNVTVPRRVAPSGGLATLRTRVLQHGIMTVAAAGYAIASPNLNTPAYIASFAAAGAIVGLRWIAIAGAAVGGIALHLLGIDVYGIVPGAVAGLALDVWRNKQRVQRA